MTRDSTYTIQDGTRWSFSKLQLHSVNLFLPTLLSTTFSPPHLNPPHLSSLLQSLRLWNSALHCSAVVEDQNSLVLGRLSNNMFLKGAALLLLIVLVQIALCAEDYYNVR